MEESPRGSIRTTGKGGPGQKSESVKSGGLERWEGGRVSRRKKGGNLLVGPMVNTMKSGGGMGGGEGVGLKTKPS